VRDCPVVVTCTVTDTPYLERRKLLGERLGLPGRDRTAADQRGLREARPGEVRSRPGRPRRSPSSFRRSIRSACSTCAPRLPRTWRLAHGETGDRGGTHGADERRLHDGDRVVGLGIVEDRRAVSDARFGPPVRPAPRGCRGPGGPTARPLPAAARARWRTARPVTAAVRMALMSAASMTATGWLVSGPAGPDARRAVSDARFGPPVRPAPRGCRGPGGPSRALPPRRSGR
jgi:hypothetical protein